ncbi:MAG: 16S rRNA (uracil(1498)-N(3))-methyltransferase [Candidatus Schekmanbacteria bacterium]|nr:MAG: 16S rRNA (uracil(1498)-N(3))-methyltransferase [Candidatus Schekmanbacteria bacterium]
MSNKIITCSKEINIGGKVYFDENSKSILKKWKIRFGEAFTFADCNDNFYRGRLERGDTEIFATVIEKIEGNIESPVKIILCQALPAKERMELIIEKAVELGVKKIVPFKSDKSITLEEREKKQRKAHKWTDLVIKASKQCRRAELLSIDRFTDFETIMKEYRKICGKIIFSNYHYDFRLSDILQSLKDCKEICIVIGPEGGFSEEELELAKKTGFYVVKAGERILRTETAAISLTAIFQHLLGDLR